MGSVLGFDRVMVEPRALATDRCDTETVVWCGLTALAHGLGEVFLFEGCACGWVAAHIYVHACTWLRVSPRCCAALNACMVCLVGHVGVVSGPWV